MTETPQSIGQFGEQAFAEALRGTGLGVRLGPFDVRVQARVAELLPALFMLYRNYPVLPDAELFDFHVSLTPRRRFGVVGPRQVRFEVDGRAPHEDMPAYQALAVLEWGINLVIALRAHRYVMLHAAVAERNGHAIVMPAMPGDGKTTLCAGLVHRGWRLFSDEFGLVEPTTAELIPLPRPMPLKGESIDVIRTFAPDAVLGPIIPETRKGTIVHVRPPPGSIRDAGRRAGAQWIVFPRWESGADSILEEVPRAEAFMYLASNAFNYELRGEIAFDCLHRMVEGARCFSLIYSDLDEATTMLGALSDGDV